ncbi:ABC transporter permease subunit [Candidatus Poribacteria bacterium]|nr:ABC transporter permease subunit [Candidatus Poribacteria bacterium]MYG09155.1 ABC transporter permease subunit [Candidatus Poribacteria bacterium]MYK24398.1 ABC transporter permease subunit [Candidatus Poribacteria bacterium]
MNAMTTRAERKQKFVLQGIPFIIFGIAAIPIWKALKKTDAADMQVVSPNVLSMLLNDLYILLSVSCLAILLGIVCAFYLEEWLPKNNWARRLIESHVAILTSIPSTLYGILAISIFFSYAGTLKVIDGAPPAQNTESIPFQRNTTLFCGEVLTFIFMVTPVTIKTTQEALRSVATPVREAVFALGASQWQVLRQHVVPIAFIRILAGGCRAMSRAFATAALLIGIYIWYDTTDAGGMSGRFILFLAVSLFLSVFSSSLTEVYDSDLTQRS